MDELYRKLLAQLEEGQDTVLAFITEGDGSIPRTTGAYMLVGREGRIFGTIGGGNLEYQAVLHAQELVQEKKSEYREYDLGTGEGKGLGMVCGGRVKVCFYFMNGAHGEAESLAQALAAHVLLMGHTGLYSFFAGWFHGALQLLWQNLQRAAPHRYSVYYTPLCILCKRRRV